MSEDSVLRASAVTVRTPFAYPTAWQLEQRRMQPRWYYRRDSRGLGIDIGYGLGWVISSDGTFAHAGSWETFAWVDPNRDIVGIILTQNVGGRKPASSSSTSSMPRSLTATSLVLVEKTASVHPPSVPCDTRL